MRLLIAMMKHETNSFSPIATPWQRFVDWGAFHDAEVVKAYRGTAMPIGAYIELAESAGADIVSPIAAEAMPSGIVSADAYRRLTDPILEAVARGGIDGAMLDLHGAMVAEGTPDGEGTLLERIRALAPALPIAVTCDLHANLTRKMVENCTALIGYKTYPHVDMHVVGRQVGRILLDALAGKVAPVMAWGNRPILAQTLRMGTDDEPMKGLVEAARSAETGPILAATVFGGFPLADMPDAGLSAVVVADGDADAAAETRDRLLDQAWRQKEEFIYRHEPLVEAIGRARRIDVGPVLLLDHADNCGSGGTQDVMTVIAEVLRQDLPDVAVAAVWDPAAVEEMAQAGVGSTVTLALGGKTDMPSIGLDGAPLTVTGKVKLVSDGEWICRGPMYTGVTVMMGKTAVLQIGSVEIVVVSRHHEPWDLGVFTSVGIDPRAKRYLVLKSRIHYRAGFAPIGTATVTCDGDGVTTSNNDLLQFERLRRPVYPLDRPNEWPGL
ncbi:MAG TPA: M81 family metallopeptidase [Aliidongia sp.]|uniref:M81 family metallopeptidase n=1 Tax=Aliidongia sp. TaxID=1914230 RepID=UPI002DDD82E6|nr:M81 family metallopeptidase [Aliidongia sp.]HEV2677225.1 M81 family metallopeptidase [Aliidongia sp.]